MFCKNCGKEINDGAVVCPNCGVATDNMVKASAPAAAPAQKNTMALVGFILSLLGFNVIALILSIIGYQNVKKPEYNGDGKGFAIAGIIISAISVAAYVIGIASCVALVGCSAAAGAM